MANAVKYWFNGEPEPGIVSNSALKYYLDGLPEQLVGDATPPPPSGGVVYRRTLVVQGTRTGARQIGKSG